MISDEDVRAICRMWAWNIAEAAKLIFPDKAHRAFVMEETAKALLELSPETVALTVINDG